MNAIAKRSAASLPAAPPRLRPSAALGSAMDAAKYDFKRGPSFGDDDWFAERVPTPAVIAEAKSLVAAFDVILQPVDPAVVKEWLRAIAGAVANPPGPVDFATRAVVLALACKDVPAVSFTDESQRAAIWRFKFWPSAAELLELLMEEATPYQQRRRDVLKIASVRPIAELPDAERAHADRRRQEGYGLFPSDAARVFRSASE